MIYDFSYAFIISLLRAGPRESRRSGKFWKRICQVILVASHSSVGYCLYSLRSLICGPISDSDCLSLRVEFDGFWSFSGSIRCR